MKERPPAFQFYPRDWLADAAVIAMPCAARGAYINLLAACWIEGSLPVDPVALRRIAGAEIEEWKAIAESVLSRFSVSDGRLRHGRLEAERQKQRQFSKLQVSRRGHGSTTGSPPNDNRKTTGLQPDDYSSSSSSSASSREEEEEEASPQPLAAVPKRKPPNDAARFIKWFAWGFRQFRGAAYLPKWGKEAPMVAELLKAYGMPRLKQMAMFLWHDEKDPWIAGTDRGIGILRVKANLLADWVAQEEHKTRRACEPAPEPEAADVA